jgi:UDP-glucose 4-epimerase
LLAQGHAVRGFDNLATGKLANIPSGVDFIEADLADASAVASACLGVDAILHQGALPSVPRSVKEPRPSHNANLDGTFNLLEGARAAGIKRVLYAASSSAYGNQPGFPRVETMKPATHRAVPRAEARRRAVHAELRTRLWHGNRVPALLQHLRTAAGTRLALLRRHRQMGAEDAAGTQPMRDAGRRRHNRRDFTYIANAVSANLLALECSRRKCRRARLQRSVRRALLAQRHLPHACQAHRQTAPPVNTERRSGDIDTSLADISAAKEAFGYEPARVL